MYCTVFVVGKLKLYDVHHHQIDPRPAGRG